MAKSRNFSPLAVLLLGLFAFAGPATARSAAYTHSAPLETHRVADSTITSNLASGERDGHRGGWYAGIHGGAVIQPDMQIRGPALEVDVMQDIGYIFDIVLGYKLPLGLRIETELSYRNNDTDSMFSHIGNTHFGDGTGGVEAASAFVNGWYDFDFVFRNWYPYAGLGLGYSKVWIKSGHSKTITTIDSSDTGMVGQVGVGMVFRYTRDLEISLDYRYLRSILEMEFYDQPKWPGSNDATYQTHSFMVGFRGFF